MKKTILLATFLLTSVLGFSQGGNAYNEGDKIFNVGIGLGSTYGGGFGSNYGFAIPLSASLEFGVHDLFSVGPYVAYASRSYRYSYLGNAERYRFTTLSLGAKGSFHYLSLINEPLELGIDESKLDLYISLYLGAAIYGYSDTYNANYTNLDIGTVIGAKYMASENIGIFTELGYGALAVWTVGASFRF